MRQLLVFLLFSVTSLAYADAGLISVQSAHDVKTTADKLEMVLTEKGMNVFGRVNHAAGAAKAGQELSPTEVVIFGNPKVGTPLMKCGHTVAIDLPQKALIWEDDEGKVWFTYNDPAYLSQRHGLSECGPVLDKVTQALGNFAKAATSE